MRELLATAVAFGRELRASGLPIDLGAAIDFARSLALVHIGDRDEVKAAGATVFIRRHEDLEIYDAVFERFWRARRQPTADHRDDVPHARVARHGGLGRSRGHGRVRSGPASSRSSRPSLQLRPGKRPTTDPSTESSWRRTPTASAS